MTDESESVRRILERTQALIDFNRLEDARLEVLTGTAQLPDADDLWAALAAVEVKRSDFAAARDAARRALSLNPESALALHALGPALFHLKDRKGARAAVDELVEKNPEWAAAHIQRAYVYAWTEANDRDRRAAKASADRAVELAPDDPGIYGEAADIMRSVRFPGDGNVLLGRALELAPTDERLLLLRASFGGSASQSSEEMLLGLVADNPRQDKAGRALHLMVWRRLTRLASLLLTIVAWYSIVATTVLPYQGPDTGLGLLAVLIPVPLVLIWLLYLGMLRRWIPRGYLLDALRGAVEATAALVATILSGIAVALGLLLVIAPLPPDEGLGGPRLVGVFAVFGIVAAVLAFAEGAFRIGSLRTALRHGLFPDTPDGRLQAGAAAKYPGQRSVGRSILAGVFAVWAFVNLWEPGTFALGAVLLALLSTVPVRLGVRAVLVRGGFARGWFVVSAVLAVGALVLALLQVRVWVAVAT